MAALQVSLKDVTVERAESLVDQIQEVLLCFETAWRCFRVSCSVCPRCIIKSLCLFVFQLCDNQDEVSQALSGGGLNPSESILNNLYTALHIHFFNPPKLFSKIFFYLYKLNPHFHVNIQANVLPCLADVDTDELEEELESLLRDSEMVGPSTLPDVPTHPFSPATEPCVLGDNLLSSLPSVPQNHFNITDEELDSELSRLTLTESG